MTITFLDEKATPKTKSKIVFIDGGQEESEAITQKRPQFPKATPLFRQPTQTEVAIPPLRGLAALGEGFQRGEAALAEPALQFLESRKPVFGEEPREFKPVDAFTRGLAGRTASRRLPGEQAQFGDVVSEFGARVLGKRPPEIVSKIGGLAFLGIPSGAAGLRQLGKKIIKKPATTSARQLAKGQKLTQKTEEFTTQLLQPSKERLRTFIKKGDQVPAVKEASKIIRDAKTFGEVRKQIDDVVDVAFTRRNEILKKNNFSVTNDYLSEANAEIQRLKANKLLSPQKISQMEKRLAREEEFLKGNPGFNRLRAQTRKEDLQRQTKALLDKKEKGTLTGNESAELTTDDLIRQGLKRVVQAGDEEVIQIDSTYGGLSEASDLLAGQEAIVRKEVPESFFEKLFETIPIVGGRRAATLIAARKAARGSKQVPALTKKIAKTREAARQLTQ